MILITNIILVVSATLTALVAGLFFAWSVSVILGLARLPDKQYISFMQATNRAIQNPLFFTAFFGAAILLPISTFLHLGQAGRFSFLLGGTIFYLIGVMGVTIFGNVPMNNTLDRFDLDSADVEEIALERKNYEGRWNFLNHIRSVSSTLAIVLVILACLN
jgi:uncharacterized membrane protein